jgi:hypothetical protein
VRDARFAYTVGTKEVVAVKTLHECIDQYEKELDAYYAHEKNNLTEIRKVIGSPVQPPRGLAVFPDHAPTVITPVGDNNKTASIIELLRRPAGASLAELASLTGWKINSIRGFLSGALGKKGLKVRSAKVNNERRYKIAA